ncbi:MAG: hypothetical protein BGO31_09900 [Bacteroidetes bacterium 43-16]|nr:MAG: hypothetical protein BGO31_09900 [Bacteroidetes bacterium 43-16]
MKRIFSFILFFVSLSSFAQSKPECDSFLNKTLAVEAAMQQVEDLDSLIEIDLHRLAVCGSWDQIDQQIMNKEFLQEIISASLTDKGAFPTYAEVFDVFESIRQSELYPSVRLSQETFETLSGKTVDWDNLEYDKIKIILITEEEFNSFKDFLLNNKFAGDIDYNYLLEQYYQSTEE